MPERGSEQNMLVEGQQNPEQEDLKSSIERMSDALPLSQVWSEVETPQGTVQYYLYKQLQPSDVAEIAHTLQDPSVTIDLDQFATLLEQKYDQSGNPKNYNQITDKNVWSDYVKLVNDILNFVTTIGYRNVVLSGQTIREHPSQNIDKVMSDQQRQLPLEQRWGLQNNIENTILIGDLEQMNELKSLAHDVVVLSSQSYSGNNLEKDQEYLNKKFGVERKYLELVYGL